MIERREHWPDELIYAVIAVTSIRISVNDVFTIIAIVEDWVLHNTGAFSAQGGRGWVRRALDAETAIQQVRDVVEAAPLTAPLPFLNEYDKGYWQALDDVHRALKGDDDD